MDLKKFLTVVFISFTLAGFSQKNFTRDADAAFKGEAYFSAVELYKKAYAKEPSRAKKAEILFNIAECYRALEDPMQAETWYNKAIKAQYPDPVAILYLADAIKSQERYDEAIPQYESYSAAKPDDSRGQQGVKSCKKSQEWKDKPSRYKVQNEVLLNSKQYDFAPSFADKKYESLLFTSTREGSTGEANDTRTGENYSDLYYTSRDRKGKWSVPVSVGENVNTVANEGSSVLNGRYNMMYFTRCEDEKDKVFACKIWEAKRQGQTWAVPTQVEINVGDSVTIGHPALSADDETLLFASDLQGGQGGKDLWYITYDKKERKWSDPVNLGSDINTSGDEMYPFLTEKGTLYFASNGHIGMGGLDIFVAESKGDKKWGKPENMGYPINSAYNDFSIILEDEKRGYFTSNRIGGKGGDDIYSFYVPALVYAIQGNVTNVVTGKPIEGATIKLVGSDGTSVEAKSDATGFYEFAQISGSNDRYVKENTSYQILVSKEEHLNAKGEETTVGVENSTTFVHDFALQKFVSDKGESVEIKFPEVQYDLGKYTLRPESKDSLNFLYQTLIDNPTIVIELSAHTDSRGSDESNMTLSQNRAKSCVDYLIEKGIDPARMVPKGYGETRLLVTDADIAKFPTNEEREAGHQKNRRTVFSVLRSDYVPKAK